MPAETGQSSTLLYFEYTSANLALPKPGGTSKMQETASRVLADLTLPLNSWRQPVLIAITGLPCTGKTEIAAYLGAHFPLIVLSTDAIRHTYGLASGPSAHPVMYEVAAVLLKDNVGLIFDGIHLGRRDRDEARAIAHRHGDPAGV